MRKTLSILALALTNLSYADQVQPIDQIKDITFRQFAIANHSTHKDLVYEITNIFRENFPLFEVASSEDITKELRYISKLCIGMNGEVETPDSINGTDIHSITCNETLGAFIDRLKKEANSLKSKSFNEYKNMDVKTFSQIPLINLAELLNYVKDEYGLNPYFSMRTFYYTMSRMCNNDPSLQTATPKQRKYFQEVCHRKVGSILKEYE